MKVGKTCSGLLYLDNTINAYIKSHFSKKGKKMYIGLDSTAV